MNRQICLAALSLALGLGSLTGALAAGHKHHATNASAQAQITDPRKMEGNNHATWCDVNSACNGWDEWLADVNEGKLKIEPAMR
jgi:hypothetical protein